VRDGIVDEIKRGGPSDSGSDANLLEAGEQKDGPEKVRELRGEDQRPHRSSWRQFFNRQRHAEVSQEHRITLVSYQCLAGAPDGHDG